MGTKGASREEGLDRDADKETGPDQSVFSRLSPTYGGQIGG